MNIRKCNRIFLITIIGMGLFAFWVGFFYKVRFTTSHLNYFAVSFFLFSFPISVFVECMYLQGKSFKVLCGILSVIFAVPFYLSGSVVAFVGYEIQKDKRDPFKVQIDEVSNEMGKFRLYQTDCGATCSFGLLLQKELDLPIGVKFTKEVWSTQQGTEGNGKITAGKHSLKIIENEKIFFEAEG